MKEENNVGIAMIVVALVVVGAAAGFCIRGIPEKEIQIRTIPVNTYSALKENKDCKEKGGEFSINDERENYLRFENNEGIVPVEAHVGFVHLKCTMPEKELSDIKIEL